MRKFGAALLSLILILNMTLNVSAIDYIYTNEGNIETAPVNSYIGRQIAPAIIRNLDFSDMNGSQWALEPAMRMGALEIVKGYDYNGKHYFEPDRNVTNQEAIAFILRALGMEGRAQQQATILAGNGGTQPEVLDLWSRGYLVVANQLGMITAAELGNALASDQTQLDPQTAFIRSNPVTRQRLADWIIRGLQILDPAALVPANGQEEIFDFSDWDQVDLDKIDRVELALYNKIMKGYENGTFKPNDFVTRATMVQTLKNMDEFYYKTQNMEKRSGVVVDVKKATTTEGNKTVEKVTVLVLDHEGQLEALTYIKEVDDIGQVILKDAVVLQDGQSTGLPNLLKDREIEYIVDKDTNEVIYVYSKRKAVETKVRGALQSLTRINQGLVTIKTKEGFTKTYNLAKPLYDTANIEIDDKKVPFAMAPIDRIVELNIVNNVVTNIAYIGGTPVFTELTGVVTENNPMLGYITIIDGDGNTIAKNYYKNKVTVEKQQFYDDFDEIGYYDEVFPYFKFDPRDTKVQSIEIGDTVSMILDGQNSQYVNSIFAKANLRMYYGKVDSVMPKGIKGNVIHLTMENGSRIVLEVAKNTPTFKNDRVVSDLELVAGDWIKVLVNQAAVKSGVEVIKVKEIIIDDVNYAITNLYRGQIATFNTVQKEIYIKNTQTLSKLGWINYQNQKRLTLGEDVEYYYDDNRVSKDYVNRYLKHIGQVYIAVESYYGSEVVKKVTFRQGKDYVVDPSPVVYANGSGNFRIDGNRRSYSTDNGTIVIRNGRLVNEQNIMIPDYAQIVARGDKAAIVNIMSTPITDNIKVYRGRIKSVEEGVQFKVKSHAELVDMDWLYSPVQSDYQFDYETIFIDDKGIMDFEKFRDYTTDSQIDEVYTVFTSANKALYVVKQPYVKEGVRGEIYDFDEKSIKLRETFYYSRKSDAWVNLSARNRGSQIDLDQATIIIKNGEIVPVTALRKGDKIRVMTKDDLGPLALLGTYNVKGYIIYVEG